MVKLNNMSVNFSLEDSKNALADILDAFVISDNAVKLRAARESAGNDMLKMMQTVFPVATQIQMNIITKYGFTADGDGIIKFTQWVKIYEKQDADVARLNAELRLNILPQMTSTESLPIHGHQVV